MQGRLRMCAMGLALPVASTLRTSLDCGVNLCQPQFLANLFWLISCGNSVLSPPQAELNQDQFFHMQLQSSEKWCLQFCAEIYSVLSSYFWFEILRSNLQWMLSSGPLRPPPLSYPWKLLLLTSLLACPEMPLYCPITAVIAQSHQELQLPTLESRYALKLCPVCTNCGQNLEMFGTRSVLDFGLFSYLGTFAYTLWDVFGMEPKSCWSFEHSHITWSCLYNWMIKWLLACIGQFYTSALELWYHPT